MKYPWEETLKSTTLVCVLIRTQGSVTLAAVSQVFQIQSNPEIINTRDIAMNKSFLVDLLVGLFWLEGKTSLN